MLRRIYYKIAGDPNEKILNRYRPIIEEINELEDEFEARTNAELAELTQDFQSLIVEETEEVRAKLEEAEAHYIDVLGTDDQKFALVEIDRVKEELLELEKDVLDDMLPEAFAAVREASKRTTGLRHYDVQLLGGMVLHNGLIAEMKTGEGKTLVATLPIYLNALAGRGVHLVTPNDYLSKIGLQLMGPIYQMLGLSAAVIQNSAGGPDKGSFMYDPSHTTDDDRLQSLRPISRRDAYKADILYGTNNEFGFDYLRDNMVHKTDNLTQRELNFAIIDEVDNILVDEARTPLIISGEARESSNYYTDFARLIRTLNAEEHYVVNEKERVATLTEDGIAYIEQRLSIENLYDPEHFDMIPYMDNALRAHALYQRDKDYIVRDEEVIIVDEFTGRLMEGRRYSEGLHQAIEAKENVKVRKESMTLATITFQNFFRMYNKLSGMTGTAKTEEEEFQSIYNLEVAMVPTYKPVIRDDMADVVYRSQQAKYKALMDDIIASHEVGQPVLVGTVAIETSEYISKLLQRRGIQHEVLNAKNHEREATIIAQAGSPGAITIATNMAGRGVDILLGGNAEGMAREQLRKMDIDLNSIPQLEWNTCIDLLKKGEDPTEEMEGVWVQVLSKQYREVERDRQNIRELGGLYVVGTERHEARRIDNQLRGRAGRLGDPGGSRFYLSMEDDLMRRFGGERMKNIMERLGVDDDLPIEAGLVSKAIENSQTKVEGSNFDIRKHVLRYDEVVNEQRNRIYEQRRRILTEASLLKSVQEMIEDEMATIVAIYTGGEFTDEWQLDEMQLALASIFPLPEDFPVEEWREKARHGDITQADLEEYIVGIALQAYADKDEELGAEDLRATEKRFMLSALDNRWVNHLTDLDRLREGIGLQAIAQVDPVVAYKREAFDMYGELMDSIRSDIVKALFSLQKSEGRAEKKVTTVNIFKNVRAHRGNGGSSEPPKQETFKKSGQQIGRNDDCHCGSGKKYKACHGRQRGAAVASNGNGASAGRGNSAQGEKPKKNKRRMKKVKA